LLIGLVRCQVGTAITPRVVSKVIKRARCLFVPRNYIRKPNQVVFKTIVIQLQWTTGLDEKTKSGRFGVVKNHIIILELRASNDNFVLSTIGIDNGRICWFSIKPIVIEEAVNKVELQHIVLFRFEVIG